MLNIKKKSFEQLSRQTEQAQEVLGTEFFYDSNRTQENLELDEKDLKEKYPYKHSQYVEILRSLAKIKAENLRNLRKLEEETGEKIVAEELKSEQGITEEQIEEERKRFTSARSYSRLSNNLGTDRKRQSCNNQICG